MNAKLETALTDRKRELLLMRLRRTAVARAGGEPDVIAPADRSAPLPLSFAQQRLWFVDQLDHAAGAAYHMPAALRLRGALDKAALVAALDRIVARHESLRTTFVEVDGRPLQRIAAADVGFALREQDLGALPADAREAEVARISADEVAAEFDLARGPLIRGQLLQLSGDEHILLITQHHIISDGWSIGILIREVSELYAAFSAGGPDPLPPLSLQYADFSAWQRGWLQGDVLASQSGFWKDYLAGAPELLTLPTDRPRPAVQRYAGGSVALTLDAALTQRLRELSQRHGATLFMTLLAGWSILLSKLSGQQDLVVGTPVANRQRRELEALIGFFANTLALRVSLEDGLSVADVLAQVKVCTLRAYEHQDLPFEQVVEAVQPTRSLSHAPLFQVMLSMTNTPGANELELPGLSLGMIEQPQTSAQFDLSLALTDSGTEVFGNLQYALDLFDEATITRIGEQWQRVLTAMADDDRQLAVAIDLLGDAGRQQVLDAFNDTRVELGNAQLIHALFAQQVAATPDATALLFDGQRLDYAELNARANRLAHWLITQGVGPDRLVAVCMQRSIEMVVALLAVMKAGGAYVPLDPDNPADRLAYMLEDCDPALVLAHAGTAAQVRDLAPSALAVTDVDADHVAWQQASADNPQIAGLDPRSLAYVIYTSGSTGQPKGAMNEHRSVANRLLWMRGEFALGAHDCFLQKTPFGFDVSVWEFFCPLISGARLVIARPHGHKDPAYLAALIREQAITTVHFVPSMLQVFLDHEDAARCRGMVRTICSGEALPVAMAQRFHALFPQTELHNLYGPTEAAIEVTAWQCQPGDTRGCVPIGRPIANTRCYILDARLQPVPVGVAGELFLAGVQVARGYLNRPALTAERFLDDPFCGDDGARMYRTGDLCRWAADGAIEYLGRNDFQIKIRGFRVELGEIEARLLACDGVREAVVVAREDAPGDKRLVAYLVADGATLDIADLRATLSAGLPEYMLPSAFVVLDTLPLNANGKLDRRALPAPDSAAVIAREYVAPVGDIEIAVAAAWQALLGVPRVGRHDSFFDLGGHSLMAVQLMSQLRRELGVELGLRDLFTHPTLEGFAVAATRSRKSSLTAIVPVDRRKPLPLSFAQQRIWFVNRLDRAAGGAYHMPTALRISGALDVAALLATLDRIVARHESLRTTFHDVDGTPVQVIAAADAGFALKQVDLSAMGTAEQEAAITRIAADEVAAPFELERGPLIRGQLLRLRGDEHVLLITQHHIITDGWSINLLIQEVSTLYQAFCDGRPDPLAPLAIQYADYAAWQRGWLSSELLAAQTEFWTQTLDGAPGLLTLPTDRPRPAVRNYAGASLGRKLSPTLTARLKSLSLRHGSTLFMTMLAGWSVFLSRLSGQGDVVIGTPVANRQRSEIESLIGFFVNTLALRVHVDADTSVADLLAQVNADTLRAYEHQDLPFEQVVEAVQPVRSMSHSPLFQVILNWESAADTRHLAMPGLSISAIEQSHSTTPYDLTLFMKDIGDEILCSWRYTSDLFDESTIDRFADGFEQLLTAMVDDDRQAVGDLRMIAAAERQQLLHAFNDTATDAPQDQLVHQLFEQQAAMRPDAMAVVYENTRLSFAELNRRANQLAHELIALGVRPDSRVAICVERSVEMIVAILGVLKAGGGYVPLDPSYPADRLQHMLADSAPVAVLTLAAQRASLPATLAMPVVLLDDRADSPLRSRPDSNPDPHALGLRSDSLAYVIYTSGSTGTSKGVMVEHRSPVNFWRAMQRSTFEHCSPHGNVALNASFSFDMSLKGILQLLSGRCLFLIPQLIRADGRALLDYLQQHAIEAFDCTPSQLGVLLRAGLIGHPTYRPTSVLIGGEAIDAATWATLKAAREIRFYNMYGPTEATVDATICCINDSADAPTIGRPIDNMQIRILDARRQPVPIGVAGEIFIGGVGVARGYLNQTALTAERFIADPFADGSSAARLYRTGDLARWRADGTIEYLGRNDFQVKVRGFRIELGEIEAKLCACPGVREAIVIAREDQPGDQRLVAYLLAQPGAELSAAALRGQLAATLAEHMLPGAFVTLPAWPLTPNGKLDRAALPAPDASALAMQQFAAPQGELEQAIAGIWQELLDVEQVGRFDNFFEIGGHSLLGVLLLSRLRQEHSLDVALRELFVHPTLHEFAAAIAGGDEAQAHDNLVAIRAEGSQAPLFLIHPSEGEVGYARDLAPWLDPEVPVYALAATGLMPGEQPLATVEDMAAAYIAKIRSLQPQGPYRIGGWSAGGTIAWEIAHQLVGADQRVEFLGLFDTAGDYRMLRDRPQVELDPELLAMGFDDWMRSLRWLPAEVVPSERARLAAIAESGDIDALVGYGQSIGELPQDIDTGLLRRQLAVRHAIGCALTQYRRPPIPVAATLFSAADQDRDARPLGWIADARLQLVAVPGDHFSMMQFPNIRALGSAIDREMQRSGGVEITLPELDYAPAITIQTGRSTLRPLFCVPGAGASVSAFAGLAQAIDPAVPIHGLQPRGLCGQLVPHVDVESAARAYVAAIRQIAPQGPYRLLGHSFGGWVAAEVARQLEASGERVEALVIVDSQPPSAAGSAAPRSSRVDMLMKLVEIYEMTLTGTLGLSASDFAGLEHDAQVELLLARLVDARLMHRTTSLQAMRGIVRVFATNYACDYVPQSRYGGPADVIVVPDRPASRIEPQTDADDHSRGWCEFAPNARFWTAPGNHMTVLSPPHVGALARWLQPLLGVLR